MFYRFVLCLLFQTIVFIQELSAMKHFWNCAQTENSGCVCFPLNDKANYTFNDDFKFQCPINEDENYSGKYIRLKNGGKLFEIDCPCKAHHLTESVYKNLNLPTGNSTILEFNLKFCPLPNGSLSTLFAKQMNSRIIQSILLRSCSSIRSLHRDSFSNMPQLKKIILRNNQLEYLPDDLFDDKLNLTELSLGNNKLKKISGKIFKNISLLSVLQLDFNAIQHFEIGAFGNLPNLAQLHLRNNLLDRFSSDVLQSLANLTILDLSSNKLTSLDNDAFQFNTQLVELYLRHNSLEVLPEGILRNNKMLKTLFLQWNPKLSTVHRGVFENLALLRDLDLSHCSFNQSSFDKHTFLNLKQLTKLNLSGNKINGLPADWFIGLESLVHLDLSRNSISTIEDNAFSSLRLLSTLNLNGNRLVRIEAKVFQGIGALKSLLLEDNKIEVIQPAAMRNLEELTTIKLSRNCLKFDEGLTFFDGWKQSPLQHNLKLEKIELSQNQIADLYSDWSLMKSLTYLNLAHNKITSLHFFDLTRLSSLQNFTLDLSYNQITHVNFESAKLVDGRTSDGQAPIAKNTMIIDENPLVCDCNAYFMAQYVNHSVPDVRHSWKINAGKLKCHQPPSLAGLALSEVNPSQFLCNCTNEDFLPCECYKRPVDKTLLFNCQHKNLNEIPTRLPRLDDYKVQMNLSYNSISIGQIDSNSSNCCADVTTLDLSHNGMNEFPMFDPLDWAKNLHLRFPRLNRLDLTHNNFNSIPNGVVDALSGMRNLNYNLNGNPWKCDCTNLALLKFIHRSWKRVEDFNQMKCDNGLLISELSVEIFCPSVNAAMKYLIAMPILALLIVCISMIVYRFRRVIRAWLYNHQLCLWCVVKEEEEENVERIYDAFISFSHHDERFVNEVLVPQLERPPVGLPHYRLCLHDRDWYKHYTIIFQ